MPLLHWIRYWIIKTIRMEAAEVPAKARRSLGIGVTNFAYYPAKNGVRYSGYRWQ